MMDEMRMSDDDEMIICVAVVWFAVGASGPDSHITRNHNQTIKQSNKQTTNHNHKVSDMLESYERECRSLEGSLLEAEENLDNTREVWHMQLDSSRNHIIMVNLWLSMISISVMATTILPAFFGMNLDSGLPGESSAHFYGVVAFSVGAAALSFPLARGLYLRHWRQTAQQELFEQRMLR